MLNVIGSPGYRDSICKFALFGDMRILPFKDPRYLLKAVASRLWKREKYYNPPTSENKHVKQVVFPANSLKCDWIDENVEENGQSRGNPHHRKPTGAQVVLPDLDRVRCHQGSESQGEAAIHEKEERNNSSPNHRRSSLGKSCRKCSNQNIRDEHAGCGREKEKTAADSIDVERAGHSAHKVPDLQEAIDESLLGGGCDADGVEHWWQIVPCDILAGPLVKDSQEDGDKCPLSVGRRGDHIFVRGLFLDLSLHLDAPGDFCKLECRQGGRLVTFCVVLDEERSNLLVSFPGSQEARRFRHHYEPRECNRGKQYLE